MSTSFFTAFLAVAFISILFAGCINQAPTTENLTTRGVQQSQNCGLLNQPCCIQPKCLQQSLVCDENYVCKQQPIPTPQQFAQIPIPEEIPYEMNVVQIKYFPITLISGTWFIDINETGDVGDPYDVIRNRTINITRDWKSAIENGSKYQGYKNPNAPASLHYNILATFEYNQSFPKVSGTVDANYPLVLTNHNVCNWVDSQNVKEFWIFAYQGPGDQTHPNGYLHIFENRLSGPYQILEPGTPQWLNLPVCNHSYWVYTINYNGGYGNALHSWSHRIENEMDAFDFHLHRELFQGITVGEDPEFQTLIHPQADNVIGRCGSVHIPPNAEQEYDYNNPKPWPSDCENWNPDGLGRLSAISCANWGCKSDVGQAQPGYLIWLLQNLPGYKNNKSYQGFPLRNWWSLYTNYDQAISQGWSLTTQNRPRCTDSDGGFNIYSKGTAYGAVGYPAGGFLKRSDYCLDNMHLVEYFCDSYNGVQYINETLVSNQPCSNGAITTPPPTCGGSGQACCTSGSACNTNYICSDSTGAPASPGSGNTCKPQGYRAYCTGPAPSGGVPLICQTSCTTNPSPTPCPGGISCSTPTQCGITVIGTVQQ